MSKRPKITKRSKQHQKLQTELANYLQELQEEEELEAAFSQESVSIKTQRSTSKMSDSEAASAAPMRKKMRRLQNQMHEIKEQLLEQRAEENAATSDYEFLTEIQEQIEIYKEEYAQRSEALYEVETDPAAMAEDAEKARKVNNDIRSAKKDCKYLLSARSLLLNAESLEAAVKGLGAAFAAEPDKLHNVAMVGVGDIQGSHYRVEVVASA